MWLGIRMPRCDDALVTSRGSLCVWPRMARFWKGSTPPSRALVSRVGLSQLSWPIMLMSGWIGCWPKSNYANDLMEVADGGNECPKRRVANARSGGHRMPVFRKPDGPEGFGFVMASRT